MQYFKTEFYRKKEYLLYDSIYIKYKNRQNQSMMMKVRLMVIFGAGVN